MNTPTAPFEAVGDLLSAHVGHYTVLQLGVAALGVAVVIGGLRWAFGKALSSN